MAALDNTNPVLTMLDLPTNVDVTSGTVSALFRAGATDVGSGVETVSIYFDRNIASGQSYLFLRDGDDSFADGVSTLTQSFSSSTPAGTYNVERVHVTDKQGNSVIYWASDLARLGVETSFTVTSNTAADNASPVLTMLDLPTNVDVTSGSASALFRAGATDVGSGVETVSIYFDRNIASGQSYLFLRDSNDSFADGLSTLTQSFNSSTPAGTYNVERVHVTDKQGNSVIYWASDLARLGVETSFTVISNAASDNTDPVLTMLDLPTSVDVTSGSASALFRAGATDVGSGVETVSIYFDRNIASGQSYLFLRDSNDSFTDGVSTLTQSFNSSTPAGTYNVERVHVTDKQGNSVIYWASDLARLGVETSFQVIDRSNGATAFVSAPDSVREGDGSFSLSLTLKDVGSTTVNTNITVSFAADQSTAANGADASVGAFSGSYSVAQSPAGNYVITLPSSTVIDDLLIEGIETLAIRVTASGQVFDSGTDSTVVRITLIDNDVGGSDGNDTLTGTGQRDALFGGAGDDVLRGGGSGDRLFGEDGADTLDGGAGSDSMIGGTGDDVYYVDAAGDSVVELVGEGSDRIFAAVSYTVGAGSSVEMVTTLDPTGTQAIDFVGNAFADTLIGNAGVNILNGGEGADVLVAFGGNDVLIGGDGAPNALQGGTGDDTYYVSAAGDSVIEFAGEGYDTVRTGLANYRLGGNVENLVFVGTGGFVGVGDGVGNVIAGAGGDDILNGEEGDDILVGFGGTDVLIGGSGNNTLQGGSGNDTYYITSRGDSIVEAGGEGFDTVRTDLSSYTLSGNVEALVYIGAGAFVGTGGGSADLIVGGGGNDELYGLGGIDTLSGNAGTDYLFGGDGDDQLNGGAGADRLTGGVGADRFVFADAGVDTITDFAAGVDRILLDRAVFAGLSAGVLAAGAFVRGSVALDADDRILYDPDTGVLLYDADGSGAQAAVHIAFVSVPTGSLSASDFVVI